jgi:hypothetical protein
VDKVCTLKNIHPLTERFKAYQIIPYANNYLLSEVFDALVKNDWADTKEALRMIDFMKKICGMHVESAIYSLSLDEKDNYLFDLAIQNNSAFIVSNDLDLLSFTLKPVPVRSSNWFLEHFPI